MILLIDNYDSFVYNLYQLIGSIDENIKVIRNDELTVNEIKDLHPTQIVISPGPGRPKEAGIIEEVIREMKDQVPILGICLGHQAIIEACGGGITYAKEVMHGKSSLIHCDTSSPIFQGVSEKTRVARYHSLAGDEKRWTPELKIIARSIDGEIMAVEHKDYPVYGLQFHPESILTDEGKQIIINFLKENRNND